MSGNNIVKLSKFLNTDRYNASTNPHTSFTLQSGGRPDSSVAADKKERGSSPSSFQTIDYCFPSKGDYFCINHIDEKKTGINKLSFQCSSEDTSKTIAVSPPSNSSSSIQEIMKDMILNSSNFYKASGRLQQVS